MSSDPYIRAEHAKTWPVVRVKNHEAVFVQKANTNKSRKTHLERGYEP